jgi:hypothetical protein
MCALNELNEWINQIFIYLAMEGCAVLNLILKLGSKDNLFSFESLCQGFGSLSHNDKYCRVVAV